MHELAQADIQLEGMQLTEAGNSPVVSIPNYPMSRTNFVAAVFLFAGTVVQASQCTRDGECPSADEPQNGVSLLQTKLQTNIIEEPRDPDLSLPGKCGFNAECPRDYKLAEVNSTTDPSHVEKNSRTLARLHDTLRKACEVSADEKNAILKNGGWCYDVPMSKVVKLNGTNVDMDYRLPLHHVVADEVIVSILSKSVLLKEDGSCCLSLTDFGAGVGQYGHALRGRLAKLEYHGYDGAGNVEEFTNNYVKFGDLTRPLSLKQTDWVLSAEVGEHIPHEYEAQVIANIHAHNCKGVILTWAVPGQHGNGHINCHSNQYLIQIFEELGYTFNKDLSAALRAHRTNGAEWFQHSAMAFDRITKPASCHGQDS